MIRQSITLYDGPLDLLWKSCKSMNYTKNIDRWYWILSQYMKTKQIDWNGITIWSIVITSNPLCMIMSGRCFLCLRAAVLVWKRFCLFARYFAFGGEVYQQWPPWDQWWTRDPGPYNPIWTPSLIWAGKKISAGTSAYTSPWLMSRQSSRVFESGSIHSLVSTSTI